MISVPKRLYKYQPPTTHALANLSAAKVWFSNPSRFNDPFDCALKANLSDVSEEDAVTMLNNIVPENLRETFRKQLAPGELQRQMLRGRQTSVENELGKTRGICCFSEIHDDLLMWGHYAESHRGFCLEFDTKFEPFSRAKPVSYVDTFPVLEMKRFAAEDFSQIIGMLLAKAAHWGYEKEWRTIHDKSDQQFGYERASLTGIYFGAQMPKDQQQLIASLLVRTDTKLFEMKLSETTFKLETAALTFKPIDYRTGFRP